MTIRQLKPDTGPRSHEIKNEEQRKIVQALVAALVGKVATFLAGKYEPPTGEELTALRKHVGLSMSDAARIIDVSQRTWYAREADAGTKMTRGEFALVLLFLLRLTPEWRSIARSLGKMSYPESGK